MPKFNLFADVFVEARTLNSPKNVHVHSKKNLSFYLLLQSSRTIHQKIGYWS